MPRPKQVHSNNVNRWAAWSDIIENRNPSFSVERDRMNRVIKQIFKRENIIILLLIVGALLGVVGVPQQVGITSDQLLLGILAVLAVDTLVERLGYLDRIETHIAQIEQKIEPQVSVDDMLRPRAEMAKFEENLQQGEEIWLTGRSLFTLISSYGRQIQQAANNGKRFRFLIVNPSNESLVNAMTTTSFSHPSTDTMFQNVRDGLASIERLIATVPPNAIQVRLIDSYPAVALQIIDGMKSAGSMIVELYGYKLSPGERLHMRLHKETDNGTFMHYLNQFTLMWEDSRPLS
jgi:hypothetical protein